jgi:hypothetical protein
MLKTISLLLLILSIICILTLGRSDFKKTIRNLIYSNEDYLDFNLPPSIEDLKRDIPCDTCPTSSTTPICPRCPVFTRSPPISTCPPIPTCPPVTTNFYIEDFYYLKNNDTEEGIIHQLTPNKNNAFSVGESGRYQQISPKFNDNGLWGVGLSVNYESDAGQIYNISNTSGKWSHILVESSKSGRFLGVCPKYGSTTEVWAIGGEKEIYSVAISGTANIRRVTNKGKYKYICPIYDDETNILGIGTDNSLYFVDTSKTVQTKFETGFEFKCITPVSNYEYKNLYWVLDINEYLFQAKIEGTSIIFVYAWYKNTEINIYSICAKKFG